MQKTKNRLCKSWNIWKR